MLNKLKCHIPRSLAVLIICLGVFMAIPSVNSADFLSAGPIAKFQNYPLVTYTSKGRRMEDSLSKKSLEPIASKVRVTGIYRLRNLVLVEIPKADTDPKEYDSYIINIDDIIPKDKKAWANFTDSGSEHFVCVNTTQMANLSYQANMQSSVTKGLSDITC